MKNVKDQGGQRDPIITGHDTIDDIDRWDYRALIHSKSTHAKMR
jgi:hypothetical protein